MGKYMMENIWWTWNPERPAEISNKSLGVALTPVLYSAKADEGTVLPPGNNIRYQHRTFDGKSIRFKTNFSNTIVDWKYHISSNGGLTINWSANTFGEWGLRYWILICIQGHELIHDPINNIVNCKTLGSDLEVASYPNPLLVTGHSSYDDLIEELKEKGYFYLNSRSNHGKILALRFNLEEMSQGKVCLCKKAKTPILANEETNISENSDSVDEQNSLKAIYSVVSWNHVFDSINARPYTCLSRNWNTKKFGGFGVWLNDILFNALLWGMFDKQKAIENIQAVMVWQTDAGNFPCLVTGNDQWLDRSQPPIATWVVWNLWKRWRDDSLIHNHFYALLKNHEWWWNKRSLSKTGLVAYGTSKYQGSGLYKGTKLAAKNESSMDNSPVHDSAHFDPETGLLLSADVGLNSLLCLDGELLHGMAVYLGDSEKADFLQNKVANLRLKISEWFWDENRSVFANRLLDGNYVNDLAPTSFYPLIAGACNSDQQKSLIENYMFNDKKFGGEFVLPSVSRDNPAFSDNVYWRGRIWGPLNYWTYHGLRRYGHNKTAQWLAERSNSLFMNGWGNGMCGENYNASTGDILDQPDTDPFYSWGALLPSLKISEVADLNPWDNLSFKPPVQCGIFGPICTPLGKIYINSTKEGWSLKDENSKTLMETKFNSRIYNFEMNAHSISFDIENLIEKTEIVFPNKSVISATVDGKEIKHVAETIYLPRTSIRSKLIVDFKQ
jgi:putative isomerase